MSFGKFKAALFRFSFSSSAVTSAVTSLLLACSAFILPGISVAQEILAQDVIVQERGSIRGVSPCSVRVRLLEAAKDVARQPHTQKNLAENIVSPQRVASAQMTMFKPEGIDDVKPQLEVLPFSSFRVVDVEERQGRYFESIPFTLMSGSGKKHRITVVPHEQLRDKIRLALVWRGPRGEELLQTQLAVQNGKSVVVGADGELSDEDANSSTVVCVKVRCD
jgi:hypothetical protein